jgi:TP901 family phage tail tape measure protein
VSIDVAVILSLVDRLSGPADRARGSLSNIGAAAGRIARVGMLAAGAAATMTAGALANSTTQAIAFEAAMADVAKVVDFDVGGVADGLVDLSRETGMAAEDLASLAAAAGQAGMDTQAAVLDFTDMASTVGVAFDLPAAYVGDAMAGMQTALGTTVEQTGRLADAINHLSNNTAANAARLLDFGQRAASVGEQYGFAAEEALAVGGAMIATGAQAEVAATSFRAVGRALTAGASATSRQSEALERLGLDAEQVARTMQEDAVGTLRDVIARLGDVEDHLRASTISDIFGDEARAIAPLINNLDVLDQSLNLVADSAAYAGSAQEEFAARADTAAFRIDAIQANWTALSREAGNALMPALNEGLERLLGNLQSADLQDNWFFRLSDNIGNFAEGALGMAAAADEMTRFHEAGAQAALVMDELSARGSAFTSGFAEGFASNSEELSAAFDGLGEALTQLFGADGEGGWMEALFGTEAGWASVGEELGASIASTLTTIVNAVTEVVELIEAVQGGMDGIIDWFGDLGERINSIEFDWSFLPEPPAWMTDAGGAFFNWLDRLRGGDAADAAESMERLASAVPDSVTAVDVSSLQQADAAASSLADAMQRAGEIDLAPVVRAALNEAQSVLASEDWSGHGARLMDTLAAGVRSGSGPLASAVSAAISQGVSQGVAAGLSSAYDARRQSALQDGAE